MKRRVIARLLVLGAVLAFGASVLAPGANADQSAVVSDCNANAKLTKTYSVAELRNALATLPVDVKEYTNCSDVIQRALLAEIGGAHSSGAGTIGDSSGSLVPTPLIVVIAVLVLTAATFGAVAARRRRGP